MMVKLVTVQVKNFDLREFLFNYVDSFCSENVRKKKLNDYLWTEELALEAFYFYSKMFSISAREREFGQNLQNKELGNNKICAFLK